MARKPRVQYEGAVYHLMSRAGRHGDIFPLRLRGQPRTKNDLDLTALASECQYRFDGKETPRAI
jgi:hypothetical protein